jgi:hypothetical protein
VWSFGGLWLGGLFGCAAGYGLAVLDGREGTSNGSMMAIIVAAGCAAGGSIIGAVRDILAYLDRRFPPRHGPEADYRDAEP